MIIAVDGPSASGKGTLARALAEHFKLEHLDTGSLYRCVALSMQLAGHNFQDEALAIKAAHHLVPELINHPALRTETIGAGASIVSAYPAVRQALLQFQRDFAHSPSGAVLDGRDIGTVVCPDADAKIFLTAAVDVRARRREQELIECGMPQPYLTILADLNKRDERDASRPTAPLKAAPDALLLDSSNLGKENTIVEAIRLINTHLLQKVRLTSEQS